MGRMLNFAKIRSCKFGCTVPKINSRIWKYTILSLLLAVVCQLRGRCSCRFPFVHPLLSLSWVYYTERFSEHCRRTMRALIRPFPMMLLLLQDTIWVRKQIKLHQCELQNCCLQTNVKSSYRHPFSPFFSLCCPCLWLVRNYYNPNKHTVLQHDVDWLKQLMCAYSLLHTNCT